jgi:hypothetical protein
VPKLSWYGGDYDSAGKPLFTIGDLQSVLASSKTPDEAAGHLRAYVGDTKVTILGVKEVNARRGALCGE